MLLKIFNLFMVCCLWNCTAYSQKAYDIQTVAFYNLENLFDTINDVDKLDERSPIMEIKTQKSAVYADKLKKLAGVLGAIGTKKNKFPPAIIGVAEVENQQVLTDLISTPPLQQYHYGIVHYDSPDLRGIDTALLYNKAVFKPIYSEAIPANIYKEGKKIITRDLLLVTGYLENTKIHLLINHWPSRRGGVKKSSILRENAARTLVQQLQKILLEEPKANIIAMGDFNDNPTDKSFKKILQSQASKFKTKNHQLFNPFENLYKKGYNTLVYRNELFLFDQLLISKNLIASNKNYTTFGYYKAGIYNPDYLTNQNGNYKGSPKRSFSGGTYLGGYSDHYPVYLYLLKENK